MISAVDRFKEPRREVSGPMKQNYITPCDFLRMAAMIGDEA